MALGTIDWIIIAAFFVGILMVGTLVARRAGSSSAEFFLGGRKMPWWLLGISMVATTSRLIHRISLRILYEHMASPATGSGGLFY